MIEYMFVYGTLLRGFINHHLIKPFAVEIVPAATPGELFHLEYGYPALVLNNAAQWVSGEAVKVSDLARALPILDNLEGYHGVNHPDNLYNREVCKIRLADGTERDSYVYVWAHPDRLPAIGLPVTGGSWKQFMDERT